MLKLNRRTLLAATATGLATCALPAFAAAHYPLKHGAFELTIVSDGHLVLPTSFLAPGAPPAEREAVLKAAGQTGEQYSSPTNVTLIRAGSDLILVDMGSGDRFMPTAGKLWDNLKTAGIDKAKITKGVFTGARRNYAAIKGKVNMIKPGDEIVPGLRIIDTPGHTQGHVSLELAGGDGLIVGGDALTHPLISFQHPGWKPPTDHVPDQAAATRLMLLDRLATDRCMLIGFHLPYPGVG